MFRLSLFAITILLFACRNGKNKPDVSGIEVNVQVQRFEQDFFRLDTGQITRSLDGLDAKYPGFLPIYLQYVLGVMDPAQVPGQVKLFLQQSRSLYDSVQQKYRSVKDLQDDFRSAFRYVKHYYPRYATPAKIITLIGPVDAWAKLGDSYTPNFLGPGFMGISLQFYLGSRFSLYQSEPYIANVAPLYRSRRFDEAYIVPDAMKLIVDDLYTDSSTGTPLIEQMIEKGKQWYLLDRFLPDTHDSLKTGFTGRQLEWCNENEGNIWSYILKENIYTVDPITVQTYLGEAPFTQNMPETSPGNIGQWVGWRLVEAFAAQQENLTVQQVLATPARRIFEGAKYKPK